MQELKNYIISVCREFDKSIEIVRTVNPNMFFVICRKDKKNPAKLNKGMKVSHS
jgi:hypothetical protein